MTSGHVTVEVMLSVLVIALSLVIAETVASSNAINSTS